jgi:hypothetical protein
MLATVANYRVIYHFDSDRPDVAANTWRGVYLIYDRQPDPGVDPVARGESNDLRVSTLQAQQDAERDGIAHAHRLLAASTNVG